MKCNKKNRFHTRTSAKKYIKKMNKESKSKKKLTVPYFCDECQIWHVTSKSKRQSRDYTRKLNKKT